MGFSVPAGLRDGRGEAFLGAEWRPGVTLTSAGSGRLLPLPLVTNQVSGHARGQRPRFSTEAPARQGPGCVHPVPSQTLLPRGSAQSVRRHRSEVCAASPFLGAASSEENQSEPRTWVTAACSGVGLEGGLGLRPPWKPGHHAARV